MKVYVLMEHHVKDKDARIHGVYTSAGDANLKISRLIAELGVGKLGYMAILKMKVKGNV